MTAEVVQQHLTSVEDYLAGEANAVEKHEYLGGVVYAMAGGSNEHNVIAVNILASLHGQLRGKGCRPYSSDTKVRIRRTEDTRFYYPDVQIICRSNPPKDHFQDEPVVVFEVLSELTRRTDEQEKRVAYLSIASLQAYVLIEQDRALAAVWRRTERGFVREEYTGLEAIVALPEVDVRLALSDVFEGVLPTP